MGTDVPGQCARKRDRYVQCLLGRSRAQQPLEGKPGVAALLGEPVEPDALVRAGGLLGGMLAVAQKAMRL